LSNTSIIAIKLFKKGVKMEEKPKTPKRFANLSMYIGMFTLVDFLIGASEQIQKALVTNRYTTGGNRTSSIVFGPVAFFVPILSPIGLIFGIIAYRQIRTNSETQTGSGNAIAGIILGVINLCASIFIVSNIIAS
jgi:hypothetical protein